MPETCCRIDPSLTRLRAQGFLDHGDSDLTRLVPWLRLAPLVSGSMALAGTLLHSPTLLLGLAGALLCWAVGPRHPADLLYVLVGRRLSRGPVLGRTPMPRRFSCALALLWVVVTAGLLATGHPVAGVIVGVAFALTAAIPATSSFCPGAWLYWRIPGAAGAAASTAAE